MQEESGERNKEACSTKYKDTNWLGCFPQNRWEQSRTICILIPAIHDNQYWRKDHCNCWQTGTCQLNTRSRHEAIAAWGRCCSWWFRASYDPHGWHRCSHLVRTLFSQTNLSELWVLFGVGRITEGSFLHTPSRTNLERIKQWPS